MKAPTKLPSEFESSWESVVNGLTFTAKRRGNIVQVVVGAGQVTNSISANTTITTLPSEFWPPVRIVTPETGVSNTKIGVTISQTSGVIQTTQPVTSGSYLRFNTMYFV